MLDVGASLLHKRNRYKHFYILTGNTNGGKSLFMSLLKHAFGPLFGVMPLSALTGRNNNQGGGLLKAPPLVLSGTHRPTPISWPAPRG